MATSPDSELYFGIVSGRKILGSTPEKCAEAMLPNIGAMPLSPMEFTVYPMSAGITVVAYVKDRQWHYKQRKEQ